MRYLVFLGRILFSAIFILSGIFHFSSGAIHLAERHGVPLAFILVPIANIISLLGGLSILLGYKARYGAILLVIHLVCVTFLMHRFWELSDPLMITLQRALFMKNLSMLGACLLIIYFGSGPFSLDRKLNAKARRPKDVKKEQDRQDR